MTVARQDFEHEHLCKQCFKTVVCYLTTCPIDYPNGQWLGGLTVCFDCSATEAPTATLGRRTIPDR